MNDSNNFSSSTTPREWAFFHMRMGQWERSIDEVLHSANPQDIKDVARGVFDIAYDHHYYDFAYFACRLAQDPAIYQKMERAQLNGFKAHIEKIDQAFSQGLVAVRAYYQVMLKRMHE